MLTVDKLPFARDESNLLTISLDLEKDFFKSLSQGPEQAGAFADRLARFEQLAQTEFRQPSFDYDHAIAIAHSVAANIQAVAESFIEAHKKADKLTDELLIDVADAFRSLSIGVDFTIPSFSNDTNVYDDRLSASVDTDHDNSRNSDYQTRAAQWLLKHLHSPYPNPATRKRLAQQSNISLRAVNDWFTHIRRRIGWSSIVKGLFHGEKQLAVDGARSVLLEGVEQGFSDEVVKAFKDVKLKAERVLEGKLKESSLAKRLGNQSKGGHFVVTPQPPPALSRKRGRKQLDAGECNGDLLNEVQGEGERPSKRVRTARPLESRCISRTASLSTSISSRASTAELLTPSSQHIPLPIVDMATSIDRWLSNIPSETSAHRESDQSMIEISSKKRCFSEPDDYTSVKRMRSLDEADIRVRNDHTPQAVLGGDDDLLGLLAQFDFSAPPSAQIDSIINPSEPLQINAFDYASLGVVELDRSYSFGNDQCAAFSNKPSFPSLLDDLCINQTGTMAVKDDANALGHTSLNFDNFGAVNGNYPELKLWDHGAPDLGTDYLARDAAKLGRINDLLAEAAKLHQEVFSQCG